MNIVMFTNTFTPVAGGVARSVETFTAKFRQLGHRVLVVAAEFPNMQEHEEDVVRIPAVQHFNGSDFSVVLPVSGLLTKRLNAFQPDVIHAHHPYLLGVTALRIARYREIPLVFTHHTRYEEYTHYVPGNSPRMRNFIIEASVRYANLVDHVIAPSESIRDLLVQRQVHTPISVIPTGVDIERFAEGNGQRIRNHFGINDDDIVIGHLGRLAQEKNLKFLTEAVIDYLQEFPHAHFLLVGSGKSEREIRGLFAEYKLTKRLHHMGVVNPSTVVDAYRAMSVFVFASKSETQGMVITEAMAAGVPVVALDAPGVREVVVDKVNGRLLREQSVDDFADAINWVVEHNAKPYYGMRSAIIATAKAFSIQQCADKALTCYRQVQRQVKKISPEEEAQWHRVLQLVKTEWEILKGIGSATQAALTREQKQQEK